jgi:hypothetical protein
MIDIVPWEQRGRRRHGLLEFRAKQEYRTSAVRRHFKRTRDPFALQIRGLMMRSRQKPVGTRVVRFRPTGVRISVSPVGKRFSTGHGITPADSSPDHPDVPSASSVGVRVDTRRTSCTMSESPVFTGDSGSARAYVLRNSGSTTTTGVGFWASSQASISAASIRRNEASASPPAGSATTQCRSTIGLAAAMPMPTEMERHPQLLRRESLVRD